MLRIIDINELIRSELREEIKEKLKLTESKIEGGSKVVVKIKTTKQGNYINIYEYDKTCWKYILTESIPMVL